MTADIVQALAQYIAVQIARIILFLLAFVVILIAWFILSHALDLGLNALTQEKEAAQDSFIPDFDLK